MFRIITVPFDRAKKGFDEELLSQFILIKCIKNFCAEFFQDGDDKYWTIFLEYDPVLEKTADKALPIGNLTSQFFANVYLNSLLIIILKMSWEIKHISVIWMTWFSFRIPGNISKKC